MRNPTFVGTTTDKRPVLSGRHVFDLKDTHGFPLSMAFIECDKAGIEIDWVGLIESARDAGWWDSQVWDAMQEAFQDCGVWAERRPHIERRFKLYIMTNIHPKMKEQAL